MKQSKNTAPKVVEDCPEFIERFIPKLEPFRRNRRFSRNLGFNQSNYRRSGLAVAKPDVGVKSVTSVLGFATAKPNLRKVPRLYWIMLSIWLLSWPVHAESVNVVNPCESAEDDAAPGMVVIRPGRFMMGSPEDEVGRQSDEGPQHPVTIPRPFALSRCEITVGQFRRFIQDTHNRTTAETDGTGCFSWDTEKSEWQTNASRYWDDPGFSQNDDHPVVCVSWLDAQHYVDWLSQRTGALYRLPTEAEWEYAARADTRTARYFGEKSQCDYANGLGREGKEIARKGWSLADCRDDYVYTAPVGKFESNPFGLYDMLGNVLEWTLDCWHDNYQNAPRDGSAWLQDEKGECDRRVVRGGSWFNIPQNLRSAFRYWNDTDVASLNLGFRVARAL